MKLVLTKMIFYLPNIQTNFQIKLLIISRDYYIIAVSIDLM